MRVTQFSQYNMAQYYINNVQEKELNETTQMSSGKQFNKFSEAPTQANQLLVIKNSIDQINQYQKNINDAKGFLDTLDTDYGSVVNILQQSREQGLKASNGTYNAQDKISMADTVEQNIQQVLSIANSQYLGKFLFSGEKTQTQPFTYNGITATYNGDNNSAEINVSPNFDVKTTEQGNNVFGNVFNELINLKNQINTGTSTDINNAVASLDSAMNDIINARSSVGVRSNTLDVLKSNYDSQSTTLQTQLSSVQDTDVTKVMSDYTNSQMIYQSILATTARISSVSLLDYMK